jgi:hypothetical protein
VKKIVLFLVIASVGGYGYALDTRNRITLGVSNVFNSVSKRGLMEIGYNYIVSTAYLTPTYNLLDFGAGLSAVFIWDDIGQFEIPTVGFTFNVPIRIYAPGIKAARLYVETDIRLVMYTEEYPSNGTWLNAGYRVGPGIECELSDGTCLFGTLSWWHSSNGNIYGKKGILR